MPSVLDRSAAYSNYMRVMPLGASITSGYGSASGSFHHFRQQVPENTDNMTGNGYRQILKDAIIKRGLNLNYVGTQHSGNMTDDDNEAYGGLRIEQVQAKITTGLKYLPSLVLILLGSNGKPYPIPTHLIPILPLTHLAITIPEPPLIPHHHRHESKLRRRKRAHAHGRPRRPDLQRRLERNDPRSQAPAEPGRGHGGARADLQCESREDGISAAEGETHVGRYAFGVECHDGYHC